LEDLVACVEAGHYHDFFLCQNPVPEAVDHLSFGWKCLENYLDI
jgi:hypothetical protein